MSWMEGAELRYTIRLEAAHLLLETGVDCAASDGETPSYIAAQQSHVEMDKELPDAGLDYDKASTPTGATQLRIAGEKGYV